MKTPLPTAISVLVAGLFAVTAACSDDAPAAGPTDTTAADVALDDVASSDVLADVGDEADATAECQLPSDCEIDGEKLPACQVWRCEEGVCVAAALSDGAVCSDGDLCKLGTCGSGKCQTTPKTCPQNSNACDVTECDAADGACKDLPTTNAAACDDDDKCTTGEVCSDGKCGGGELTCDCQTNDDCAAKENGDKCDGTLFCNKAKGACEVNPASVVTCSDASDTACKKNTCNKITGTCAHAAVNDGTACNDGEECTKGDVCGDGSCVSGKDTCTCQADTDCASEEDGNACNGLLFCNK